MWKTGHSLVKAKMRETASPLAGEMSGHMFFGERWYGFDDAQYVGARLLEICHARPTPTRCSMRCPIRSPRPSSTGSSAEGENAPPDRGAAESARFPGARDIITIDGLRVEYADGFGLARASNTTPVIVLRFEGDSGEAIARIQARFRACCSPRSPAPSVPF